MFSASLVWKGGKITQVERNMKWQWKRQTKVCQLIIYTSLSVNPKILTGNSGKWKETKIEI